MRLRSVRNRATPRFTDVTSPDAPWASSITDSWFSTADRRGPAETLSVLRRKRGLSLFPLLQNKDRIMKYTLLLLAFALAVGCSSKQQDQSQQPEAQSGTASGTVSGEVITAD